MTVIGYFLIALADVLNILLTVYMWIIVIRAVISWVNPDPYNPIVNFLYRATEPVLSYVRRVIPPISGIDLSPILVLLAIVFLNRFLVGLISEFGHKLKMGAF
ncbi:MAG: YggT family protein [Thermodesulfobacteriota bacterium]